MGIILGIISLLLFIGLLSIPIIVLKYVTKPNSKFRFVKYLVVGLIISAFISLIFAWWNHKSDEILLDNYDAYVFNIDSNSFQIDYKNVLSKNLEKVKNIEKRYMGIGWSLKAIFLFVFCCLYLLIMYLANYTINRIRYKNR